MDGRVLWYFEKTGRTYSETFVPGELTDFQNSESRIDVMESITS